MSRMDMTMEDPLAVYLHHHLAGAAGAMDLLESMTKRQSAFFCKPRRHILYSAGTSTDAFQLARAKYPGPVGPEPATLQRIGRAS